MVSQATSPAKPSGAQLAYMRDLSERTGSGFVYPVTAAIARKAIHRRKLVA